LGRRQADSYVLSYEEKVFFDGDAAYIDIICHEAKFQTLKNGGHPEVALE
jgi:hypothetical protein